MHRTAQRQAMLAALFVAVTAVAAQLSFTIPALSAVPFTLQVLAVVLTGALLPPRWAFAALAVYVLLGAFGVPVFAGGRAGFAVLLGPTGGYLFSYPVAAAAVARLAGRSFARVLLATFAGLLIIYVGGAGWAIVVGGRGALQVLTGWVLPFIPYDLVKIVLASLLAVRIRAALAAAGYLRTEAV
jgi:biotin transport system substrate-specific component